MPLVFLLALAEALVLTAAGLALLPSGPELSPPGLYLAAAGFSNTALICLAVNLVLTYPLVRLGKRKAAGIAAAAAFALLFTAAFVDFKVYSIYRFHLNFPMLDLFLNAGGDVISFSGTMWLTIAACCAVIALICAATVAAAFGIARRIPRRLPGALMALTLLLFLACNLIHAWSVGRNVPRIYRKSEEIPLYYPLTSSKLFPRSGEDAAPAFADADDGGVMNYPLEPLRYAGAPDAKLPSIYLILIDSLRADAVNPDNMPNLSAIASENLVFANHRSGGNATRNGVFTLFYGLPGSYWQRVLAAGRQSALITALQDRNYLIGAFAGAQLYKPEFNRTVFADVKDLRLESRGGTVSEKDRDAVRDFEEFVRANPGRPKFALLFLDKLHAMEFTPEDGKFRKYPTPWTSPNYVEIDKDFDRSIIYNLYRNTALAVDAQIGEIAAFLRESGEWDDSIVVISSDHGNEFDDNGLGFYGHNSNFTDAQIKIPLIVAWPGRGHEVYGHETSSYDLTATLLPEALGALGDVSSYTVGKSLFDPSPRDIVISSSYLEDAVVRPGRIIVMSRLSGITLRDGNYRELDEKLSEEDKKLIALKMEIDRKYVKH